MKHHYEPHGVCSTGIDVEVEDGIVQDVYFEGGCSGNSRGLSALVKGMRVEEVLARLEGTRCGARHTSCPDQLCHALRETQ
jgi:uncharacterized protein (TIGR03905 family)